MVSYRALYALSSGEGNVALGSRALESAEGSSNVSIGWESLKVAVGDRNVAIGTGAGRGLTSGDGNVFLGYNAGSDHTSGDKKLYIGYDSENLLYGDFGSGDLALGINDIGTVSVNNAFYVNGAATFYNTVDVNGILNASSLYTTDLYIDGTQLINDGGTLMWNGTALSSNNGNATASSIDSDELGNTLRRDFKS